MQKKELIPIVKNMEHPITRKVIRQILQNANPKLQTAILIASSGGLCIGELAQLRLFDVDFTTTPTKILVRAISKGKMSRETFITEEATIVLKDYLKKYFGWHQNSLNLDLSHIYIFGKASEINNNIRRFNATSVKQSMQVSLRNHIKNIPELAVKNEKGGNVINFQVFRKYFKTVVGNVCGIDYAEALVGNDLYMDRHYQLSSEEKHQKYLSAEPYLIISDFEKAEQLVIDLSDIYIQLEKSMSNLKQYLVSNNIPIPVCHF